MIDSLFILGEDKQIVIEKHWKGIVGREVLEPFYSSLTTCVNSDNIPPVLESNDCALVIVKENNLIFIATMKNENSPLLVIEFLHKLIRIFKTYIGVVNEAKIRSNFSIVYQLLDEVADFGVPVITEPSIMSSLIQIPSVMNKVTTYITKVTGTGEEDTWLPGTGNSTVTWRRPDLKYSRNEIRFFIIEYINATVTQKGKYSDCSGYGTLRVQSHLSQNPEIVASLTGTDSIEGIFLHSCVDRSRFNSSKTLQFVPLDGVFDVMNYSIKKVSDVKLNFSCRPSLTWTKGDNGVWGQLDLGIGGRPQGSVEGNPVLAIDVVVEIVLPPSTTGANINSSVGRLVFNQEEKKLQWFVGTVHKEDTFTLKGPVFLGPDAAIPKSSLIANLRFIQVGSGLSGLNVTKIQALRTKGEYNLVSGVQRELQSGNYDIQM